VPTVAACLFTSTASKTGKLAVAGASTDLVPACLFFNDIMTMCCSASAYAACLQIIIYGIDSVLIAEESLPFDQQFFSLLSQELKPGGAKVPAALIVDAVEAGDIAQVAAVFDQAVAAGEVQQLVEILAEVRTTIIASCQELSFISHVPDC